jgi:hypothetical protein
MATELVCDTWWTGTETGLLNGQPYYVSVTAVTANGAGSTATSGTVVPSAQPTPSVGVDSRTRYISSAIARSGYDYAPSIIHDGSKWAMYDCGQVTNSDGSSSDGIIRSTSSDGVTWTLAGDTSKFSQPGQVLGVGAPSHQDGGQVCDPSVLRLDTPILVESIAYSWAMWYTGLPCNTNAGSSCHDYIQGPNRVYLAVSNDGVAWTKRGGNLPVVDCGTATDRYGCGQPSVVKIGTTFHMSHAYWVACTIQADCGRNRIKTSHDGVSFTAGSDPQQFRLPHNAIGPDFMYRVGTDTWLSTVIHSQRECSRGKQNIYASAFDIYVSDTMFADQGSELASGRRTPSAIAQVACLSQLDVVPMDVADSPGPPMS